MFKHLLKSLLKVETPAQPAPSGSMVAVDVYASEDELLAAVRAHAEASAATIEGITAEHASEVARLVFDAHRSGRATRTLAKDLSGLLGGTASDAKIIAQAQLAKVNGKLTQLRQEAQGVKEYTWRTCSDERVRDAHRKREGKRFRWESPPPGGHPGEEDGCRCYAEPVLSGLEDLM